MTYIPASEGWGCMRFGLNTLVLSVVAILVIMNLYILGLGGFAHYPSVSAELQIRYLDEPSVRVNCDIL